MIANTTVSAEIVDRVGFFAFLAMSALIIVCIGFGFYAVYEEFSKPDWKDACIAQGGIPIQYAKSSFDCKILD
jgi:hypothetical protein